MHLKYSDGKTPASLTCLRILTNTNRCARTNIQSVSDRQFILVGDSGEMDPEIYGKLAVKYPET